MFRSAVLAAVVISSPVLGAPAEDHWGAPPSAEYGRAVELVASARYAEALTILKELAEKSPGDADVFNLLGFSHRKSGDLALSAAHYERALRLNPDHRGALAYQGELFLMRGDVAGAEANLSRLTALCPAGCEERSELEKAFAAND